MVLAGGRGARLKMLTNWRAKPAMPFGGKFRIIDFALSNCINSGVRKVYVLTQYKSHSLIRHLLRGWNFLRGETGEFVELIPAQQWVDEDAWYEGTADAVYQSLDIIAENAPQYVLILAGDHVYKMDYGEMLAAHVASGADFTIACHVVPVEQAREFGVMGVDEDYRVTDFVEKPERPPTLPNDPDAALISMGVYVFSFDYLLEHLLRDAADPESGHDFGKDIIPYAVRNQHNVQAYSFSTSEIGNGYWRDVGTLDAYYEANMELLESESGLDLYNRDWRIFTYQEQLPSAKFVGSGELGRVQHSMVSGGCVIHNSVVEDSILFSNVQVGENCDLQGVVALPDCRIGSRVRLRRVMLDKRCVLADDTCIGEDPAADAQRFYRTESGIVVVNSEMLGQEQRHLPSGTSYQR
jgi:glucose-1-phosphate adenylyltransferase